MKALDKYNLMVVFTLLLNRVHIFANFMFIPTKRHGIERVKLFVLPTDVAQLETFANALTEVGGLTPEHHNAIAAKLAFDLMEDLKVPDEKRDGILKEGTAFINDAEMTFVRSECSISLSYCCDGYYVVKQYDRLVCLLFVAKQQQQQQQQQTTTTTTVFRLGLYRTIHPAEHLSEMG